VSVALKKLGMQDSDDALPLDVWKSDGADPNTAHAAEVLRWGDSDDDGGDCCSSTYSDEVGSALSLSLSLSIYIHIFIYIYICIY